MRKLVVAILVAVFLGGGLVFAGQEQRTILDGVTVTRADPLSDEGEAGGTTPQSSESLSADGTYLMWFDTQIPIAYVKIGINMVNSAAYGTNESVTVTATLIEDK